MMAAFTENRRASVCVVDDDESVRESLAALLDHLGFDCQIFASAEEYLLAVGIRTADCLILDVTLPGLCGPELHIELLRRGLKAPVIFISAYFDSALAQRLKKQGAVRCLSKPFTDTDLLQALNGALAH